MKGEERHKLQTNELADWLGQVVQRAKPYAKVALIGLTAVVALWAGWVWWHSRQSQTSAAASRALFAALSKGDAGALDDLAEQYRGTAVADLAALAAGDMYLQEGCDELFRSKSIAIQQLRKSLEHYRQVQQLATEPLTLARATFGLARAYEALAATREGQGELDRAVEAYEAVLTRWPNSPYAIQAKERVAALKLPQTKAFYDKLAQYEPLAQTGPTAPGGGGAVPFDLESLPEPAATPGGDSAGGQPAPQPPEGGMEGGPRFPGRPEGVAPADASGGASSADATDPLGQPDPADTAPPQPPPASPENPQPADSPQSTPPAESQAPEQAASETSEQ